MSDSTEKKHEGSSRKRRKLSTINFVYKTFFEEGRDSDIKIIALNREWNLHKSFLSQSPYFESMFSGAWVEKKMKEINLVIEDENITAEALHKVLGSLYSDEIQIETAEVVPILACATFLQLDDLIKDCTETMKACINKDTAVRFFEVAEFYSIEEVKNVAFDWLCRNVCEIIFGEKSFPQLLIMINEDLMKKLLTSSDLCVPEELNVVAMLNLWIYLKENSYEFDESSTCPKVYVCAHNYFYDIHKRYGKGKSFLETDSGLPYQSLFHAAVRIKNLFLGEDNIKNFEENHIFPAEWCMPVFKTLWHNMLSINTGTDIWPDHVSEEVFDRECVRISGYISSLYLVVFGNCWKKIYGNFDFGFGLTFYCENGSFKIKRDIKFDNSEGPAFLNRGEQYLMYRVSLFSEDSDGRVLSKFDTGIQTVLMAPNEKIEVLTFKPLKDPQFHYRINFLLTAP